MDVTSFISLLMEENSYLPETSYMEATRRYVHREEKDEGTQTFHLHPVTGRNSKFVHMSESSIKFKKVNPRVTRENPAQP